MITLNMFRLYKCIRVREMVKIILSTMAMFLVQFLTVLSLGAEEISDREILELMDIKKITIFKETPRELIGKKMVSYHQYGSLVSEDETSISDLKSPLILIAQNLNDNRFNVVGYICNGNETTRDEFGTSQYKRWDVDLPESIAVKAQWENPGLVNGDRIVLLRRKISDRYGNSIIEEYGYILK